MTLNPRAPNLEPVRTALAGEPLLVLGADGAVLACNANELVFTDEHGLQRLSLREIRKVTHVDSVLVVAGDGRELRGKLAASSAELKAFFADLQNLRKARGALPASGLESSFKPSPVQPTASDAAPGQPSPREPVRSADIPGFGLGLAAPLEEHALEPAPPRSAQSTGGAAGSGAALETSATETGAPETSAAPPETPAPTRSAPEPAAQPKASAQPRAGIDPDEFYGVPKPGAAKPNPRAALAPQREALPPRKADPRAASKPVAPEPPVSPPLEVDRAPRAPQPEAVPAMRNVQPNPKLSPSEATHLGAPRERPSALPRTESAPSKNVPRAEGVAPNSGARAAISPSPIKLPRVQMPSVQAPQIQLPRVDVAQLRQRALDGARVRLERAGERGRFNLRRLGAGLIDLLLTAALVWLVTRPIGGREFETLLGLPAQSRLDLGLLSTLKDLLPLVISGALSATLAATAAGLVYALGTDITPLQGSLGKKLLGLQLETLSGARPSLAVVAGRFLVKAMLLLVPGVLGLIPTLLALGGSAVNLRSTLGLFGVSIWISWGAFVLGALPLWGAKRNQTLPDYLTDCVVRDAPVVATVARSAE